jgi:hypothetical protein
MPVNAPVHELPGGSQFSPGSMVPSPQVGMVLEVVVGSVVVVVVVIGSLVVVAGVTVVVVVSPATTNVHPSVVTCPGI